MNLFIAALVLSITTSFCFAETVYTSQTVHAKMGEGATKLTLKAMAKADALATCESATGRECQIVKKSAKVTCDVYVVNQEECSYELRGLAKKRGYGYARRKASCVIKEAFEDLETSRHCYASAKAVEK